MSFKLLPIQAGVLGLGLVLASHAAAGPKDLTACVWGNTSDAERTALSAQPDQLSPNGQSFDQIAQTYPSASAAIDHCRNGAVTPALWKGHFISNLDMEHWAATQVKAKANIDASRLEQVWDAIPADRQICFGVLTAWAIASTDKNAAPYLATLPIQACSQGAGQANLKDTAQSFMKSLQLDPQSEAGKYAAMYAFGKGGEAVVIRLIEASQATPPTAASN